MVGCTMQLAGRGTGMCRMRAPCVRTSATTLLLMCACVALCAAQPGQAQPVLATVTFIAGNDSCSFSKDGTCDSKYCGGPRTDCTDCLGSGVCKPPSSSRPVKPSVEKFMADDSATGTLPIADPTRSPASVTYS